MIGAIAAIAGAIVGSLASYAGQARLVSREDDSAARGAARVALQELSERVEWLGRGSDAMRAIHGQLASQTAVQERAVGRVLVQMPAAARRELRPMDLSLTDRKLIASRVSANEWASVSKATTVIAGTPASLSAAVSETIEGPELTSLLGKPTLRSRIENTIDVLDEAQFALEDAERALSPIAGYRCSSSTPSTTPEPGPPRSVSGVEEAERARDPCGSRTTADRGSPDSIRTP